MIPKEWHVTGNKARALRYCLKVTVKRVVARWAGYLPFCGSEEYIEYVVPVLTVDTGGKVQSGILPAKRETLLEMAVVNFVHLCSCKA
jgi:hypothetical protein